MSAYRDKDTAKRMASAGDIAEKQFEAWAKEHGLPVYRYGLHGDAPFTGRPFLQCTPDYLTSARFYEVQGIGKDRLVKIKTEKMLALREWDGYLPVWFWLFDAVDRAWAQASLGSVYYLLQEVGNIGYYPEGAQYRDVPVRMFHWDTVTTWVQSDWHDE